MARRKATAVMLAFAVLGAAVLGVWVWLGGTGLPWAVRTALGQAGFDNLTFDSAAFDNGVLRLEGVTLSGAAALRIARVEAQFGAESLAGRRLSQLRIEGVRGRISLNGGEGAAVAFPPVDLLRIDDVDIEIDAQGVIVAFTGALDAERSAAGFRFASRDGKLRSMAEPAWFVPLRLEASGLWPAADAPVDFSLKGGDETGALAFEVGGAYAVNGGDSQVRLRLFPLVFIEDVRPAEALFPVARRWIEALSGTLSGDFTITGRSGAWRGGGQAEAKQVTVTIDGVRIERIDTSLRFSELFPPAFADEQSLRIGRAVLALPFEDIVARFTWPSPENIRLLALEARLAGGRVTAMPMSIGLRDRRGETTLTVENVSLHALLAQAAVDGLSGEGILGGQIPLSVAGQSIRIRDGKLAAVGAGTLAYRPRREAGATENEQLAILRQVLTDFRYKELTMSVDGEVGGEQAVIVRLVGSNPSFYDGYPVAFTLNLSGALEAIVRRGMDAYALPDTLRTQIERLQKEKQP